MYPAYAKTKMYIMSIQDETMSDEIAFETVNNPVDNGVQVTEEKEESATEEDNTSETNDSNDTDSTSSENKDDDVSSEEEQKVPYSRFKTKIDELEKRDSVIADLEKRLADLENTRQESDTSDELEVPQEWIELYGNSDASKRAFKIQVKREQLIQENAVKEAIKRLKEEEEQEVKMVEENESIIEDNLSELQKTVGKKLTKEVEEAVLSIVDEFSPVGEDGKYITLFPFDKAYEIYTLRSQKATNKTNYARKEVANLANNNSAGESDSSDPNFERGWDNWRKAI